MRVLHLINALSAGGAELHLLTLCRHQREAGIAVSVACLREHAPGSRSLRTEFEAAGIPVTALPGQGRFSIRFIPPLIRLLETVQPDILHTHLPRADLAGAMVRPRVRWVSTVHNVYNRRSWSGAWILPLMRHVWRRPDALIAISEEVRRWLRTLLAPGEREVDLIYYGIDVERFQRSAADLRSRWNLDGHRLLGCVARLVPHKGHDLLLQALPKVLRAHSGTCLIIVGGDPVGYRAKLEALAGELEVTDAVRFVGFQDDVRAVFHALDLMVLVSESEGFGQVTIEAMAAGKPVIATRMAPMTEIVTEGETGLLVERTPDAVADAIDHLLADPDLARAMGLRGRERAHLLFSAEQMATRTVEVYERLLRR